MDDFAPTRAFAGTKRYRILRTLGTGSTGSVYEALDIYRQMPVAIKTLVRMDPFSLYRFKREFRDLAAVSHPNLAQLYELSFEGSTWFFSMELVDGPNWLEFVRSGNGEGPIDADGIGRIRQTLPALAEALRTLHAAGLCHRDVKPNNVLVSSTGRVVLVDFGVVARIGDADGAQRKDEGSATGTPAYMAPEQVRAEEPNPAADWYSAGVMVYEAIAGRLPFEGDALQVMMDKQRGDIPSLSSLAPDAPSDLVALTHDLLQLDPGRRPHGVVVADGCVRPERRRPSQRPAEEPIPSQRPRLVGRAKELDALQAVLRKAHAGRRCLTLMDGPSGIGKTALISAFLGEGRTDPDLLILEGRCYAHESVPYNGFDSIVDELSDYLLSAPRARIDALVNPDSCVLTSIFPVLERVPAFARLEPLARNLRAHELRALAFSQFCLLVRNLAARFVVVICIDDFQWADSDTVALVRAIMGDDKAGRCMLLAAYRREDADTSGAVVALRELGGRELGDCHRSELRIRPLSERAILDLAQNLIGGEGRQDLVRRIAEESGGSPFFVSELSQYVRHRGHEGVPAHVQLHSMLRGRLQALPSSARRLLETFALAARPLRLEVAAAAASLSISDGQRAFSSLKVGALVHEIVSVSGARVEVSHDKVREHIVADLAPDELPARHRALAASLRSSDDGDPEVLFTHYQAAGMAEPARANAVLAAERARSAFAFDREAHFLREAVALIDEPRERHELQLKLADAYEKAGRGAEAARTLLAARDHADRADQLELERRSAEQLLCSGHFNEGMAAIRDVLRHVGMRLPASRWVAVISIVILRVLVVIRGLGFRPVDPSTIPRHQLTRVDAAFSVALGLALVDTINASTFATRQLLFALQAGDVGRVCRALLLENGTQVSQGHAGIRRGKHALAVAERLAPSVTLPEVPPMLQAMKGWTCYFDGRWRDAIAGMEQALAMYLKVAGQHWFRSTMKHRIVVSLAYSGQLRECRRRHQHYLAEANELNDLYLATLLLVTWSDIAWLRHSDPAAGRRSVENALERWGQNEFQLQHWYAMYSLAQMDLYEGAPDAALARVQQNWQGLRRSFLMRVHTVAIEVHYLRARARIALAARGIEPRGNLRKAKSAARTIERMRFNWAEPIAALLLAAVASGQGQRERSIELLRQSVNSFERMDMAMHAAVTRYRLGQLLQGNEGQSELTRAKEWMREEGVEKPDALAEMMAPGFRPSAKG